MSFTESSHIDANNRTKKVMAFGTFDIFHPGHVYYLTEAERLGDSLIVVIARDERVAKLKGRKPKDDETIRHRNVSLAFKTAEVILGDVEDIFAPLHRFNPDILVFGYDQVVPEDTIKVLFPTLEIVRVGSYEPEKWKSSLLREQKEKEAREDME